MSSAFETVTLKDGRVLVILHPACGISKEDILALLVELGVNPDLVTFLQPQETVDFDLDAVPVVIPLDQASCDAPEVEEAGRRSAQAGGRVIVLIGPGFPYTDLHPLAEKYGAQCGWSAAQLGPCMSDAEPPAPRSHDGTPIARPEAGQVKC